MTTNTTETSSIDTALTRGCSPGASCPFLEPRNANWPSNQRARQSFEAVPGGRTYSEIVRGWARERELLGSVQPYTAHKAEQKALLLEPWIGPEDVADIEPAAITDALMELGAHGGRKRRGLSASTLRAAHLAGSQAMSWAISRGLAKSNPFKLAAKPQARRTAARFLTPAQAASFSAQASGEARKLMAAGDVRQASFRLAACIAVATGLRRGEIFALEWDDVDWARGRMSVTRAVKADGVVGEPKSASGTRSVAVGPNLLELLDDVRRWHCDVIPERGWAQPECIICNADGERASMNSFENWWKAWTAGNGWKGLRFHDLRHTHATMLIAGGADVKTVQMRLGHSSAEITLSVYAHAIPLADKTAATSLDAALFA